MPTFKMSDLQQSEDISTTVVRPSQGNYQRGRDKAMGRVVRRTVEETKMLIMTCVFEAGRPVTFLEICDYLERRPTPHLRGIVNEIAKDGQLLQEADEAPGGIMPRFWYRLP